MQVTEFQWNALSDCSLFVFNLFRQLQQNESVYPWSKTTVTIDVFHTQCGWTIYWRQIWFYSFCEQQISQKTALRYWFRNVTLSNQSWSKTAVHFLFLESLTFWQVSFFASFTMLPISLFFTRLWSICLFQRFGDFDGFYSAKALQMSKRHLKNILTITVIQNVVRLALIWTI